MTSGVNEFLRLFSSAPITGRTPIADIMLHAHAIRANEPVALLWATANFNPKFIERPLDVDFKRANLVEVRGNQDRSETVSISVLQRRLEDGRIGQDVYWGRWLDRWSLRGGRWAIYQHEAVLDCHIPTIVDGSASSDSQVIKSRRDNSEPSYALFAFA